MKAIFLFGLVIVFLLVAAGGTWLIVNYHKSECILAISRKSRILGLFCAFLPLLCCCYFFRYNTVTVLIAAVHLFVLSLLTKGFIALLSKLFRFSLRNDITLGIGLVFTCIVLLFGYINMHTVRKTAYTVTTDKTLPENGLRIAMISDVHLSTCMNGKDFENMIETISGSKPDVLLICGDLVDESSKADDLDALCSCLKRMETKQGVWFVFGNHDSGIYGKREIPKDVLKTKLEEAGVRILEDSSAVLEGFALIGRSDASNRNRKSASELAEALSSDTFTVMMDHQPTDYDNESAAGIDLVVSGHTHGGQMFPGGQIGMMLGANDLLYGKEVRDKTTFLVSSGASGWAIPFKTGTVSEYVLIDILPS